MRQAKLTDIDAIVPFIKIASGGLSEFLLSDLIPGVSADLFIEMALTDENTTYHYNHILVAESNSKIIAASNYYPSKLHCLPDLMRSFIAKEKLKVIEPYLNSRVDGSMYINTMGVAEEYRNSLCGLILGKKIEAIAREQDCCCLSAHVWIENTPLYKSMLDGGFKVVEEVDISHQSLPYKGGMVLLKGPDLI